MKKKKKTLKNIICQLKIKAEKLFEVCVKYLWNGIILHKLKCLKKMNDKELRFAVPIHRKVEIAPDENSQTNIFTSDSPFHD